MTEFIDIKNAINVVRSEFFTTLNADERQREIEKIPTCRIVNCEDCIHFKIKGEVVKYGYCDMWNYPIDEFGFCYLGRENENIHDGK